MKSGTMGALRPLRVEAGRVLFCLSLSLLGAAAASAAPKMPPGAFLRQPAESVQELNRQLRSDPLVCARYARLYNMPVQDVRAAFIHLRLTKLAQDQVFQIHYVHSGERIGYKVRRVRKGTPIYTFEDGTPVLVQVCGNPVRGKRPSPSHQAGVLPPENGLPSAVPEFSENEELEAVPSSKETELSGLRGFPPGGQLPPSIEFVEVPFIPLEAPTDTSTLRLHRPPPVQHIKNWIGRGAFLLPLAALPFLMGGGGGSTSTSESFPPGGGTPGGGGPGGGPGGGMEVTPEAGSLWLFVTGGGALLLPALRKFRSRRAA